MTKVHSDTLPSTSALWSLHATGDFLDCYSVKSSLSPREAATIGFSMPIWVKALLAVRNRLVRPFGLKTGAAPGTNAIAIFPICSETPDEMILGLDDSHLDFRVAVLRQDARIYMSTWVHPHNLGGRAYLQVVMPFHIAICRGILRRMAA
jgi:Protein of unknown function (DUF2867)